MEPRIVKYTNWWTLTLATVMVYTFDWVCISFLKVCLLTVESTWCCSWRLHVTVLLSDCHIGTYINDRLRIYGCTWLYKPVRVNLYWHQKMLWVRHRAETIAFVYRWMMITNAIVLININVFFSWRLKKKIMNVLLTVQSTRSCYWRFQVVAAWFGFHLSTYEMDI